MTLIILLVQINCIFSSINCSDSLDIFYHVMKYRMKECMTHTISSGTAGLNRITAGFFLFLYFTFLHFVIEKR